MAQPAGGRPPGIEDLRVESFKLRVDAHVKRAVLLKRESSGGIGPGTSPLPDYDRVPDSEKQGLRNWFRPGRVWIGSIIIPGGDVKTRYVFQVVEWNVRNTCWVVSHAAHGDEQLCYLRLEDDEVGATGGTNAGAGVKTTYATTVTNGTPHKPSQSLKIFFSDAETTCDGVLSSDGMITGKVAQLLRPEHDSFAHEATARDVFQLEPAVGACFTPMVEARVARLARWRVYKNTTPDIFKALDVIQKPVFRKERFKEMVCEIRSETRLVSVAPLTEQDLASVATAPPVSPTPTGPYLWAAGSASLDFAHSNDGAGDFARDGEGGPRYDDDDVETVDDGVAVDARHDHSFEHRLEHRFEHPYTKRTPYASVMSRGSLEMMNMRGAERDWWRLWRSTSFATEAECCATRERARRLKGEVFVNPSQKKRRVKDERKDGRKHAHHRSHVLFRRQHALLWRTLNASDMPPNLLNEVVGAQARALRQSEFRLRVAYTLFDEALRGFENRISEGSIEKRCFFVPPGGTAELTNTTLPAGVSFANTCMDPCTICGDCVCAGESVCALDCGHLFHADCVKPWLHDNPCCPNCRGEVTEDVEPGDAHAAGGDEDGALNDEDNDESEMDYGSDAAGDDHDMDSDFDHDHDGMNPFGMSVFDHMMRALSGEGSGHARGFPMPVPQQPFWGEEEDEDEEEYDTEDDSENGFGVDDGEDDSDDETSDMDDDAIPDLVASSDDDEDAPPDLIGESSASEDEG